MTKQRDSEPHVESTPSTTTSIRERVREQLAAAQQVITALRAEVAHYRRENLSLDREKDGLRRALAKLEVMGLQQRMQERDTRPTETWREQLEQSRRDLELQKQRSSARHVRLERNLAVETEHAAALRLEIACLEQQVEELLAIVSLLSDDGVSRPNAG